MPIESLFIYYGVLSALECMVNFLTFYCEYVNFYLQFVVTLFSGLIGITIAELIIIQLIARFSKICPKGMESTGITCLLSLYDIPLFISG